MTFTQQAEGVPFTWSAQASQEQIDFTSDASQELTIPAGTTVVVVTSASLSVAGYLSTNETGTEGIRISTTSATVFGVPSPAPTIYARRPTGTAAEAVNVNYY